MACWALVGGLALTGSPAAGDQDASPSFRDRVHSWTIATLAQRCLTPAVDGVFTEAVQRGAFLAALGTTFTITDVSARGEGMDVTIAKAGGSAHTVTLALERIIGRVPDGRAGAFVFYLQGGADAEASGALLALAQALAERIPATALAPCRSRADTFATRAVALRSAALAVLIVAAALLFGFRKLRRAVRP